jgi:hypothetical protein
MDDERWEPGMPVLDRQAIPERAAAGAGARTTGAGTGTTPGARATPGARTASGAGTAPGARTASGAGTAPGAGTTAAAGAVTGTAGAYASPFGATPVPESLRGSPPRSVPEARPTPLQKHYVLLSAPALVLGAIAITALEMGAGFGSPIVKICVLIAAPLLLVTTADATLRIWRSAWAWMPVDRGRGLFRLTWVLAAVIFLALIVGATLLVLGA